MLEDGLVILENLLMNNENDPTLQYYFILLKLLRAIKYTLDNSREW